jgi:hypothetical protein
MALYDERSIGEGREMNERALMSAWLEEEELN